jgi:hypothetical protein
MIAKTSEIGVTSSTEIVMPLERASEALGLLASGKASGKVVFVPGFEAREGVAEPWPERLTKM